MPDEVVLGERRKIGERLRKAREYLGFSQDEVATHLGIPRPSVTNIENGLRQVSALELQRLALLYQRSIGYFLSESTSVDNSIATELIAGLDADDVAELNLFAEFLRFKRRKR